MGLVRTVLAVHAGQLGSAIAHAREGLAICGAGEPRVAVSLEFLFDALAAPADPAELSARRRWPTTTPCAAALRGAAALDTRRSGSAHE